MGKKGTLTGKTNRLRKKGIGTQISFEGSQDEEDEIENTEQQTGGSRNNRNNVVLSDH